MSNLGYDINEFSIYLDSLIKENIDIKYTEHQTVNNSVKIMTIHKSKGLEYPICYFSGLYKSFNVMDIKEKFTFSNKYGILTPYFDEGVGETIYKPLLKYDYLKEEISEKIRLFYVALTRAKEKMILLIPYKDILSNEGSGVIDSLIRSKYNSLLDIINSVIPNIKKYITMVNPYEIVTKDYNLLIKKDYKSNIPLLDKKIKVEELNILNEEVLTEHYSKTLNNLITKEEKKSMDFGIEFHETLEYFDLKTKDYSLITNEFIKNKVIRFSNLEIFNNINDADIYHEYEFIYNLDNKNYHGIIDLMIEYSDHIDIIDYKLKDITDIHYIDQLKGYKTYIESINNKEVNIYLYSILDETLKKM